MAVDPQSLAIHDEVVVETEIDGADARLPAFVTNVLAEELWLATRQPDPRLRSLAPGQPIHLTFERGSTLVVESEFVRRLGRNSRPDIDTSRVFAVRRPQGVKTVQRRAHVRIDLDLLVRIRAPGSLGAEQLGTGRSSNIGAGGVQFTTAMPLQIGQQLRLAIVLTSQDIVVAGGPVVRLEDGDPGPDRADGVNRVAVRFDKISEADQERITCHILSAHRKLNVSPAARVAGPEESPASKAKAEPTS